LGLGIVYRGKGAKGGVKEKVENTGAGYNIKQPQFALPQSEEKKNKGGHRKRGHRISSQSWARRLGNRGGLGMREHVANNWIG